MRSIDNKPVRVPTVIIEALSEFFKQPDLTKPN